MATDINVTAVRLFICMFPIQRLKYKLKLLYKLSDLYRGALPLKYDLFISFQYHISVFCYITIF